MDAFACQPVIAGEKPTDVTPNGKPGPHKQGQSDEEEALVTQLIDEMRAAWRQGQRPLAEVFLHRHPELCSRPQAGVRLIYEEICLRQEYGLEVGSVEVVNRFPRWRGELKFLLDCHGVLQPIMARPVFPSVGETWNDYELLAELGRGTFGRVFLAKQLSLGNRPLVLKMMAVDEGEYLSLARLQHTYIMPLYAVEDDPARHLRALCMPYFGGTTLQQILGALADKPVGQRTGEDILLALERVQAVVPEALPRKGPARQLLARASYVQAVCWIGSCLAEALQYAHERGLVHLDLKPHNILLAGDGQPMLLDFNLAREPIQAGVVTLDSFGGTLEYMSPEQQLALDQIRARQPIRTPVDGRSDVYSLGLVLYEALGGPFPLPSNSPPYLQTCNPNVSPGMADLVHKCLTRESRDRYPDAGALASDLRRQLADLPLRGVTNRSLSERWSKWRRRKPHALVQMGMLLTLIAAGIVAAGCAWTYHLRQLREADMALAEAQVQFQSHAYAAAIRTLNRGIVAAEGFPANQPLLQELQERLKVAQRAQAAHSLHVLADRLRFCYGMSPFYAKQLAALERQCPIIWETRHLLMQRDGCELETVMENQIHDDLLDLALVWANLRVRLAAGQQTAEAQRDALRLLQQAESLFGANVVVAREYLAYAEACGRMEEAQAATGLLTELQPKTAWEHSALGRFLLYSGTLPAAMIEFDKALNLRPQDFWANFYQGTCAYRLHRYEEAVTAFRVCLALAPDSAECFYNRGLAEAALNRTEQALSDYSHALAIERTLAAAALNRGILYYERKQYKEALTDLQHALEERAAPVAVHYNMALVHLACKDRTAALHCLRYVLENEPEHKEARELYERLIGQR